MYGSVAPTPRRPRGREPVRFETSRKPSGGLRWMSRLDPADDADMHALVGRIAPRIERSLGLEVKANRVRGPGLQLEPWLVARARWEAGVDRRLSGPHPPVVLVADVRDFYGSTGSQALGLALRRASVPFEEMDPLLVFLRRLRDDGVPGLPVGPLPSAVLANAVLSVTDLALRASGASFQRWVDDFVVFAEDQPHAARLLDVARRALGSTGLELNEAKTMILDDPAQARARLARGVSGSARPSRAGVK